MTTACLDDDVLAAHAEGRLPEAEADAAAAHLDACDRCRRLLAAALQSADETFDRYVILGVVGSGGMGVVYAAYDPELDRKVALKLLRPERSADGEETRARLQREAQAMARLSHENVITVHDVVTAGERLCVAMEFVDGMTLRAWLAGARRPWREVLDLFVRAGRGLAAAHRAGIVHRDFKPDNVLVGKDGRVRVTDFGLARLAAAPPAVEAASPPPDTPALAASLTRTGMRVGTPAYMAPEQIRGEPADARSDMFSFCVALYEAIFGVHPFEGATLREREEAMRAGRISAPVRNAHAPAWLKTAVSKGLRAEPAARHADMEALLAALDRDPARRRRGIAVAVVMTVMAVAVVVARQAGDASDQVCRGAERRLAGIWDGPRKRAVAEAFAAAGAPGAAEALRSVERLLDAYAATWTAAHTQTCEATRVLGEQSEELLDRRMQCLGDRLGELSALIEVLAHADAQVVKRAPTAAGLLYSVDECAASAALREQAPRPSDPALVGRIAEVRRRFEEAHALYRVGRYEAALPLAEATSAEAKRIRWAPLEGVTLRTLALVQSELGRWETAARTMERAGLAALRGRDDRTLARAYCGLIYDVGYRLGRIDDGLRWAEYAEAAVARLGDEGTEADRLTNLGLLLQLASRYEEARAAALRAAALNEKTRGPKHLDFAKALDNAAILLRNTGSAAEALPRHERALAIFEAELGPQHVTTVMGLQNYGLSLVHAGRAADALPVLDRAIALAAGLLDAKHPTVAKGILNRGVALLALGRSGEALEADERALGIYAQTLAPDHLGLAEPLTQVGLAQLALGRPLRALPVLERALAIRTTRKAEAAGLAQTRFALARALTGARRDRARARELAGAARSTYAELAARLGGAFTTRAAEVEAWLATNSP